MDGKTINRKKTKGCFLPVYKNFSPSVPSNEDILNKTPQWTGCVTGNGLNVRTWAGIEHPNIKNWPTLNKGNLIGVYDTIKDSKSENWYYY